MPSMSYLVVLCGILGVGICLGQEDYLNHLIDTIFNSSNAAASEQTTTTHSIFPALSTTTKPQSQIFDKPICGDNKKCVPYFLCKNDAIVKDGTGIIDIRVDGAECSYLDICCSLSDEVTTPTINISKQEKGCGYQNIDGVGFKITGNKNEAQFAEFPWMLAILSEEKYENVVLNLYKCGGSLINQNVALTAAHCVQKSASGSLKIRAGEWDTQSESEILPFQERRSVGIAIHPLFDNESLANDIALIFLDSPFEHAENVNLLCLPPADITFVSSICYATGWGKNEFGQKGKYQVILKKIDLGVVPNEQCQEYLRKTRLGNHFELHQSFLCAGGEAGKDTCKGDGGSPLFCLISGTSNRYFQVGVVSWGIGCGEQNIPGVYSSISYQRSWIDNELKKQRIEIPSLH